MTLLIVGLVVFIGIHSLSVIAPQLKPKLVASIGEGPWKGLYSIASLAGFIALIWGYGDARLDPQVIYFAPTWLRHIALLLLLAVFPLFLATYLKGHIKQRLKHPTLLAVKVWAFAHLLANGMLADLLLFGTFLAWAVVLFVVNKKRARASGIDTVAPTYSANFWHDIIAIVGGLILYVVFVLWLHQALIGVAPVA